jgi:hypothetical protein
LSVFAHCDKIPERINLKGGKVDFGSWFWRVQSMVGWPCCLWAIGKAAHRGEEHMVEPSCSPHGSQGEK